MEEDYNSKKENKRYNKNNLIPFNEVQERTRKEREARLIEKMCEYAKTLNW